MAVIFLHKGMRYGWDESLAAVMAMEPWQVDELAPLGEYANQYDAPVGAVHAGTFRLTFFKGPAFPEWARASYEPQEFIEAPQPAKETV